MLPAVLDSPVSLFARLNLFELDRVLDVVRRSSWELVEPSLVFDVLSPAFAVDVMIQAHSNVLPVANVQVCKLDGVSTPPS